MASTEHKTERIYIPDSNVLINNPFASLILAGCPVSERYAHNEYVQALAKREIIYDKTPNTVCISEIVEQELDHLAHDPKERDVAFDARNALAVLHQIRKDGLIFVDERGCYATLENGARVYFIPHNEKAFAHLEKFNPNMDDRIVFLTSLLKDSNPDKEVRFISQDKHARSKALGAQVTAEEFRYENIRDPNQLYPGFVEYDLISQLCKFAQENGYEGALDAAKKRLHTPLHSNQVLIFKQGDERIYRCVEQSETKVRLRPLYYPALLKERTKLNNKIEQCLSEERQERQTDNVFKQELAQLTARQTKKVQRRRGKKNAAKKGKKTN